MALLDFEKAFDTISWQYLHKVLKHMKFGPYYRQWIKIIYTDITSCCINNGHSTAFFPITRGIRQGCPISAETLATRIRSDPNVHGITVGEAVFKISQPADGATLFLKDSESIFRALNILKQFALCSGLKLNKNNTFVVPLHPNGRLHTIHGIEVKGSTFKTLGIFFDIDQTAMYYKNLEDRLSKFKAVFTTWSVDIWTCILVHILPIY